MELLKLSSRILGMGPNVLCILPVDGIGNYASRWAIVFERIHLLPENRVHLLPWQLWYYVYPTTGCDPLLGLSFVLSSPVPFLDNRLQRSVNREWRSHERYVSFSWLWLWLGCRCWRPSSHFSYDLDPSCWLLIELWVTIVWLGLQILPCLSFSWYVPRLAMICRLYYGEEQGHLQLPRGDLQLFV